jgi:glycosyltransferase involved in cell wall biosynthesis
MLAIIIPYYKLAFFEATLQSLANQTNKQFKVYIGDDASPEDCSALLKKFEGSFDFNYHRFETNLGGTSLSKQWERCIAMSSNEEWMMILGDDDWLSDNVVEEFYKNLNSNKNKYNVVRFATKLFFSNKQEYSNTYHHPVEEKYAATYLKKLKGTTRSSLSENIFKRKMYTKHGFHNYPLAWNSDDRAWFDFSESKPIFTINEAIVYVSVSEGSISGMDNNLEIKNRSQALFYSYLLWSFKLNFAQKVEISYLILTLQKNSVSYFTRLYARILIKISRNLNT